MTDICEMPEVEIDDRDANFIDRFSVCGKPQCLLHDYGNRSILYLSNVLTRALNCKRVKIGRANNYILLKRTYDTDETGYVLGHMGRGGGASVTTSKAVSSGLIPKSMFGRIITVKKYSGGIAIPVYD